MSAPFTPIDPAPYAHAPKFSVSSGITLAHALVAACPEDADPRTRKACKHLKKVADQALSDFTNRNKKLGEYSEEDSRGLDNEADRCWGALRMRLQALAMIPEHTDRAGRAAALDQSLFHGSMEFLKAEYGVQRTRMAALLKQIDEEKLGAELNALAGLEFLTACRDAQPRYERMVNERLRRDTAMGQNLNETVSELSAAIINYASKILASTEPDDEASHDVARAALRPIDAMREAARSGSLTSAPADAPPKSP